MNKISLPKLMVFALALLVSAYASAEIVVVVGASSPVPQMTRDDVINIFMGRYRRLQDGSAVVPVEPGADTQTRKAFYFALLGKSVSDIHAYWVRLVFSGRTSPPEEVATDSDVISRVARNPYAIGYVDRQSVTSRVRIVCVLSDQGPSQ